MTVVAAAVIGAAVVGAGTAIYVSNNNADAAEKVGNLQYKAQQEAMAAAQAANAQAESGAAAAAEMYANATTEAARINAEAAMYAADQNLKASQEALAIRKAEWEKMQADMAPYLKAGGQGLNQLSYGLGLQGYNNGSTDSTLKSGYLQKAFSEEDFKVDPGYNFRLTEGIKALDRSASARGNLLSGSALKGIETFGQGLASQEYQNAYNRYTNDQNTQYNHLQNLTNMGASTAVQMGSAGLNYANAQGNTLTSTAQANGQIGINSANTQGNLLTGNAAYSGSQSAYANNANMSTAQALGQYGINGANALGNAALQKANANASSYQAYGSLANQLASAYGYYNYNQQPSTYNPSAFNNYNSSQWAGSSNYGYY